MNLHQEWRDEMLVIIEEVTNALRGIPDESKLGWAIFNLKARLSRIERMRYRLGVLREVMSDYLRAQTGERPEHFSNEVQEMCEDWLGRNPKSRIWSDTAAREAISRGVVEYERKHPFKPLPPT